MSICSLDHLVEIGIIPLFIKESFQNFVWMMGVVK